MKKLISMVLVLALSLGMSTSVFAADATLSEKSSQSIDVQAKYEDKSETPIVYSVDIAWGDMQFTYAKTGTKTWKPADHSYEGSHVYGWTPSGNTVEVTNHSNDKVTASFKFDALDAYKTVTGSFDNVSKELAAGVENEYDNADSVISTLTVDGTLDESITTFTKVGTITVTID